MTSKITKAQLEKLSKKELNVLVTNVISQAWNEGTVFEAGVNSLVESYKSKKSKIEVIMNLFTDNIPSVNSEKTVEDCKKRTIEDFGYFKERSNDDRV